jgi:hypothetical protein
MIDKQKMTALIQLVESKGKGGFVTYAEICNINGLNAHDTQNPTWRAAKRSLRDDHQISLTNVAKTGYHVNGGQRAYARTDTSRRLSARKARETVKFVATVERSEIDMRQATRLDLVTTLSVASARGLHGNSLNAKMRKSAKVDTVDSKEGARSALSFGQQSKAVATV